MEPFYFEEFDWPIPPIEFYFEEFEMKEDDCPDPPREDESM